MVCPELEAMQIENNPAARTAVRWVVLRISWRQSAAPRGAGGSDPAGELTVNALLLVLILLDLLVGEPNLVEQSLSSVDRPGGSPEEPDTAAKNQEGRLLLPEHLQVAETVVRISQTQVEQNKQNGETNCRLDSTSNC